MRYEFQNSSLNTLFILTRSCLVLTQVETLQREQTNSKESKEKWFVYVSYSYIIKKARKNACVSHFQLVP